jgi:hypothetical protein
VQDALKGLNGVIKNHQSTFDLFAAILDFKDGWTKFVNPRAQSSSPPDRTTFPVNILHDLPSKTIICNDEAAAY